MKRSKSYRARNVQSVKVEELTANRAGESVVVGVDVGKSSLYLAVRWPDGTTERPVVVKQPGELELGMGWLERLKQGRELKVVLEPTGTYGDAFRYGCHRRGIAVERVSPVAAHRHAEVYDGVASQHDGKDAGVLAELGYLGKSRAWPFESGGPRRELLAAHAGLLDAYRQELDAWRGRLEGKLARHWPEVTSLLELDAATLLEALMHYASPAQLAADPQAHARLAGWGGHFLKPEKVEAVMASARGTWGVPLEACGGQGMHLAEIARRVQESLRQVRAHHRKLARAGRELPEARLMGKALGTATMALLHVEAGDPALYGTVGQYRRALGLNLVERSSGAYQGPLHISKRGSAASRRWLYLAALRLINKPGVKQWYQAKVARDGGKSGKALMAVMRKTAAGIHHCRRTGEVFDSGKLFAKGRQGPLGKERG